MIFYCPVCQSDLIAEPKRYVCDNGHSFDRAKEGYVNLLLANQRNSKQPGDSREMINSRRAFLNAGYYHPLARAVSELIATTITDSTQSFFDMGCGEGYYTAYIQRQLPDTVKFYGVDISKDAIRLGAKQYNEIEFAVASINQLPIHDNSVDIILNIFSPRNLPEMARITRENAYIVSVTPYSNHLRELREAIYDEVYPYNLLTEDAFNPDFTLIQSKIVEYPSAVTKSEDIANLLQMTPFYWNSPQDKQAELMQLPILEITFSFMLTLWQKNPNSDSVL